MRRACLTSSGIATRSWSMRSRTAACSRMMLLVIGTFRALTTSASSRSTRNCMSKSPSRSGLSVPQEQQSLFTDLLHAHRLRARWQGRRMFAQEPRDDERTGREGAAQAGVRERFLQLHHIRERRIRERERERTSRPRGEVARDVGGDDRPARQETGRPEISLEGAQRLVRPLDERDVLGTARKRLDPKRARAGKEVEDGRIPELGLEDREERLADPGGRRARSTTTRDHERSAFRLTGDHPHQARAYRRQSWSTAPASSSWSGRSSYGSLASVRSASRAVSSISCGSTSARSTMRSSGAPDWRVPRNSPAPRISRSRIASSKPFSGRPSFCSTIAASRADSEASLTRTQYARSAPRPTRPRS